MMWEAPAVLQDELLEKQATNSNSIDEMSRLQSKASSMGGQSWTYGPQFVNLSLLAGLLLSLLLLSFFFCFLLLLSPFAFSFCFLLLLLFPFPPLAPFCFLLLLLLLLLVKVDA